MAMIPSYQDMLAQALQQQPQQQQSMGQSQQSKSIFNNPAFGNALTRMGVTMLANSGQGLSTGEAFGQGGLAFLDERQKQEELQREEQRQNAILARQQLQDNLQKMALQREAMTYDAAAQAAQNLPEQYRLSATVDPLGTVKQQMTDTINAQDAERKFAQQVQLQNMQYGNQRALAQEQSQSALAQKMYENQAKQQQAMGALGLFGQGTDEQGKETNKIPPYLQKAVALATTGDLTATINARAEAEEEKVAAEQKLRGSSEKYSAVKNIIEDTKNILSKEPKLPGNYQVQLSTGPVQALPNMFLGSDQQQLANNLQSIKSNATLQELMAAKENGVTFGPLSNEELRTVASAVAKLEPTNTPKTIEEALKRVDAAFEKIAKNTQSDYERQYGVKVQSPNANTTGGGLNIREQADAILKGQ
jgi:hypothetical protein